MRVLDHASTAIATVAYTGFFPFAPATFATAVFLGVYMLAPWGAWLVHPLVVLATLFISVPVSTAVEKQRGTDPHCVVIDEVVGIQMVLVGASPTPLGVMLAFVFFRLFDVWKPAPVNRLQSLPGGWGIVADDVVAGLYARAVVVATSLMTPTLGRFLP